jgi:Flp pilus assembly protein TadD
MKRSRLQPVLALCTLIGGFSLGGCAGQLPDFLASSKAPATAGMTASSEEATPRASVQKSALREGKEAFRARAFGLAEANFRRAVEETPDNIEAWLGLAATHDELGRFDLADRDYAKILRIGPASAEVLNNRGYSYLLRGDRARARTDFFAARKLAPENETITANLQLLDEHKSARI